MIGMSQQPTHGHKNLLSFSHKKHKVREKQEKKAPAFLYSLQELFIAELQELILSCYLQ